MTIPSDPGTTYGHSGLSILGREVLLPNSNGGISREKACMLATLSSVISVSLCIVAIIVIVILDPSFFCKVTWSSDFD